MRQQGTAMNRVHFLLILWMLTFAIPCTAQTSYEDVQTPEGWALQQIKNGEVVDFNRRCGSDNPLSGAGADDRCRRIAARFVVDMLTVPKWSQTTGSAGLWLRGPTIQGSIDLSGKHVTVPTTLEGAFITGDFIIAWTEFDRFLRLDGTTIQGRFNGSEAKINGALQISRAVLSSVEMSGIKVSSIIDFDRTLVNSSLSLRRAVISDDIYASDATFNVDLTLDRSTIGGALVFERTIVEGQLNGENATIKSDLTFTKGKIAHLSMRDAKITGNVDLRGTELSDVSFEACLSG
jgi:hypothetical protein